MSIDIFKIDGNNNMIAVDQEKMDQEEFSDLQIHIEAWINEALTRAIEEAEKEQGTKNK